MNIGLSILLGLIAAPISACIASRKNRSAIGYGLLGLLAPLIGIIAALVVSKRESVEEREARLRADGMAFQIGAIAAWQATRPVVPRDPGHLGPAEHVT